MASSAETEGVRLDGGRGVGRAPGSAGGARPPGTTSPTSPSTCSPPTASARSASTTSRRPPASRGARCSATTRPRTPSRGATSTRTCEHFARPARRSRPRRADRRGTARGAAGVQHLRRVRDRAAPPADAGDPADRRAAGALDDHVRRLARCGRGLRGAAHRRQGRRPGAAVRRPGDARRRAVGLRVLARRRVGVAAARRSSERFDAVAQRGWTALRRGADREIASTPNSQSRFRSRRSSAARDDDRGCERANRTPPTPRGRLLELYDDALPVVYGYFVRRCADRATAEDLTSETFLAAMDAARRPQPPPIAVPWLLGVARHKLADHYRRRHDRRDRPVADVPGRRRRPTTGTPSWTGSWPRVCWPGCPNRTARCWRCATWTTARCPSAPS